VTGGALPGRRLGEDGVALIVVLLLLALLLTIVGEFTQAMRIEAVTAANFRAGIAETWLAEAAYQRALAEILPDALGHELDVSGVLSFRRTRLGTPTVPERLDVRVDPGRLSYRITDESARINLNRATRDVLDRLLQDLGAEKTDRDTIIDSIQDWRDPNDEHRLNGAESDYYLGLPVPYRSKNGDFNSVDELLQVRGMTRELLYGRPDAPGLAEHLTVFGAAVTNMNTASPVVLRALGFAPAEVDFIVARRPWASPAEIPAPFRRGRQQTRTEIFRIEAWAGGATPSGRVLTAVVERQGGTGQPQGGTGEPQGGTGQPQGGTGQPQGGTGEPQGGTGQPQGGTGRAQGGIGRAQAGVGQTQGGTRQTQGGTGRAQAGVGQTQGGTRQTQGGTGQTQGGTGQTQAGIWQQQAVPLVWRWSEASRPTASTPTTAPDTGGRRKRP
jgi:type II secretory pathway component PulK